MRLLQGTKWEVLSLRCIATLGVGLLSLFGEQESQPAV